MLDKILLKYFKCILFFSTLVFFSSGCTVKQTISKKTDKLLISTDNTTLEIKNKYVDTTYSIKNVYNNMVDSISNNLVNNEFLDMLLPDDIILKNRKNLIIWKENSTVVKSKSNNIISNYIKENNLKLNSRSLSLNQKIKILNDYFFIIEQNKYKKEFSKKYPKPEFDKFKSDKDNIIIFNQYKHQLYISKSEWLLNLNEIKKKVATNILASLYGNPKIVLLNYNPNDEIISLTIGSNRNNFKQSISFDLEPKIAKELKDNKFLAEPIFYFILKDDELKLISASMEFENKQYLVKIIDKIKEYKSDIKLSSKKLDLKKLDIDYKVMVSNIQPPSWFYELKTNSQFIGYGTGETLQVAKNIALSEIAQSLEVNVNSNTVTNKQKSGDFVSSDINQKIKVSTGTKNLKGSKTIKSEKKDGIWFIAVSYTK